MLAYSLAGLGRASSTFGSIEDDSVNGWFGELAEFIIIRLTPSVP